MKIQYATANSGPVSFLALAKARRRHLADRREQTRYQAAGAALVKARDRWDDEDWLAALLAVTLSPAEQLEMAIDALLAGGPETTAGEREALRQNLRDAARVVAIRWLGWVGITWAETMEKAAALYEVSPEWAPAVEPLPARRRSHGPYPDDQFEEAYTRLFPVLRANRRVFSSGSFDVMVDAGTAQIEALAPGLAARLVPLFKQYLWACDNAFYADPVNGAR